jgi:hypothetical protein
VYRASISRIVGLVVAPCQAASARGPDARGFRIATPPCDADPSAPAPGSMSRPVERRGGGTLPMQQNHARALGKTMRAIRQSRAIDVARARTTLVERICKVE